MAGPRTGTQTGSMCNCVECSLHAEMTKKKMHLEHKGASPAYIIPGLRSHRDSCQNVQLSGLMASEKLPMPLTKQALGKFQ